MESPSLWLFWFDRGSNHPRCDQNHITTAVHRGTVLNVRSLGTRSLNCGFFRDVQQQSTRLLKNVRTRRFEWTSWDCIIVVTELQRIATFLDIPVLHHWSHLDFRITISANLHPYFFVTILHTISGLIDVNIRQIFTPMINRSRRTLRLWYHPYDTIGQPPAKSFEIKAEI